MRFFVCTLDGDRLQVEAELSDTMRIVKDKIHANGGPKPERQRLIFAGKEFPDDSLLQDSGIQVDSSFHMVEIEDPKPEPEPEPQPEPEPEPERANELADELADVWRQQQATEQLHVAREKEAEKEAKYLAMAAQKAELAAEADLLNKRVSELEATLQGVRSERRRDSQAAEAALQETAELLREQLEVEAKERSEKESFARATLQAELEHSQADVERLRQRVEVLSAELTEATTHVARERQVRTRTVGALHKSKGETAAAKESARIAEEATRAATEQTLRAQAKLLQLEHEAAETVAKLRNENQDLLNQLNCKRQEQQQEQHQQQENDRDRKQAQVLARVEQLGAQLEKHLAAQQQREVEAAAAAATQADAGPFASNLDMDTGLTAVTSALQRYNADQQRQRYDCEQRALAAEANAAEAAAAKKAAVEACMAAKHTAEQRVRVLEQQLQAAQGEIAMLQSKLDGMYQQVADILPAARHTASKDQDRPTEVCTRTDVAQPTVRVQAKKVVAKVAVRPRVRALTAPTTVNTEANMVWASDLNWQAPAKAKETATTGFYIQGVGGYVRFLIGSNDIVRVTGERKKRWMLASGRCAKKFKRGVSWVWHKAAPRIQYLVGDKRFATVTGSAGSMWTLENGRTVDKNMEGRHYRFVQPEAVVSGAATARASCDGGGGRTGGRKCTVVPTTTPKTRFVSSAMEMGLDGVQAANAFDAFDGNTERAMDSLWN